MVDEYKELGDFIQSALNEIERGLGENHNYDEGINFDIAVVKTKSGGAGFKIFVADASGKYSKEEITKISFVAKKNRKKRTMAGGKWAFTKV